MVFFRYADEVSINDEVLAREHDQLKAVKVKEISNIALQGNWNIVIATCHLKKTQQYWE